MNLSQLSRPRIQTFVEVVLLALAAALFAVHYLHLSADFPNHSPWMDWSKYTDEGWYGDAAIRQIQRGSWNLPGDFNPARSASHLAAVRARRLPLHRRKSGRRARPRRLGLRPHPRRRLPAPAPHALPSRRRASRIKLPRARRRNPPPRGEPLLLRLHPSRNPRAAPHPLHAPCPVRRLLRGPISNEPPPRVHPSPRARPLAPADDPHQDHRGLPHPIRRLDALGLDRLSPAPLPPRRRSRRTPRRRDLARLLRPPHPPALPRRLSLPLQRQRLYRNHPRQTPSRSSPTPSKTASGWAC